MFGIGRMKQLLRTLMGHYITPPHTTQIAAIARITIRTLLIPIDYQTQ